MFKIEQAKKDGHLAEISQNLNIRFSFAKYDEENKVVTRLHEFVKCRDFLGDVIWANSYKQVTSIYGFKVDPKVTAIDTERTVMLMQFPEQKDMDAFLANYEHIVHEVEAANNLAPSRVILSEKEPLHALVIGDKFWQSAIFLISLYTFLLKSSSYKYKNVVEWRDELKTFGVVETGYIKKVYDWWNVFVSQLHTIRAACTGVAGVEQEEQANINTLHNNCGFVSVLGNWEFMDKQNSFAKHMKAMCS